MGDKKKEKNIKKRRKKKLKLRNVNEGLRPGHGGECVSLLMPFIMQKGQERARDTRRRKEQHPRSHFIIVFLLLLFYFLFQSQSCRSTWEAATSTLSTLTAAAWRPLGLDDEATAQDESKRKEREKKAAGQNYLSQCRVVVAVVVVRSS